MSAEENLVRRFSMLFADLGDMHRTVLDHGLVDDDAAAVLERIGRAERSALRVRNALISEVVAA